MEVMEGLFPCLGVLRVRLRVYKGMVWNGIDLVGKGIEWNLKILFGCYKIKEWK